MIVKLRDARAATITRLEEVAIRTGDPVKKAACISAAARLRDDSTLECVCLDSRFVRYGITMDDNGRCEAHSPHRRFLISSPMKKMERDSRMLSIRLGSSDVLPRHFGIGPRASVRGYILTNPSLRSIAAMPEGYSCRNSVSVETADALFPLLWKRNMKWSKTRFERLTPDALRKIAERLASQHQPNYSENLLQHPVDGEEQNGEQQDGKNSTISAIAADLAVRGLSGA